MSDFDKYNIKIYNNIYNNDKNINKDFYLKADKFSDLFSINDNKEKETIPILVPVFEALIARYNLSSPMLRNLMTLDNIRRVGLNYQDVCDALDYIDKKRGQIQPIPQGTSYNSNTMWSPVSNAGTIYEWNRGVIGISYDGEVEKEKLDGTINHHADATIRISRKLGANLDMETLPFKAGLDANESGILILQFEGDKCFVYFPNDITKEQNDELTKILTPRANFEYSFIHRDQIFEEQNLQSVLSYASDLAYQSVIR